MKLGPIVLRWPVERSRSEHKAQSSGPTARPQPWSLSPSGSAVVALPVAAGAEFDEARQDLFLDLAGHARLARAGVDVERAARTVTVHELELLAWQPPDLEFRVRCSKGTYVRTLVEDIGELLDCGAHVTALRRLLRTTGANISSSSSRPAMLMIE